MFCKDNKKIAMLTLSLLLLASTRWLYVFVKLQENCAGIRNHWPLHVASFVRSLMSFLAHHTCKRWQGYGVHWHCQDCDLYQGPSVPIEGPWCLYSCSLSWNFVSRHGSADAQSKTRGNSNIWNSNTGAASKRKIRLVHLASIPKYPV